MIFILSREEKELISRLRSLTPLGPLNEELVRLKRDVADLEIKKAQREEEHAKQERELRHMIGLEKKRQEVEIQQAKRDTELTVREGNLVAERARFEQQLKFNTERFEKMEGYLKGMMADILARLPNVTMAINQGRK